MPALARTGKAEQGVQGVPGHGALAPRIAADRHDVITVKTRWPCQNLVLPCLYPLNVVTVINAVCGLAPSPGWAE